MNKLVQVMKDNENKRDNLSVTENGTIGYKSTHNPLVDLNFKVSELRNVDEDFIISEFKKALEFDRYHTLLWLFYLRDIKEGCGERRAFRVISKYLLDSEDYDMLNLLEFIPTYGRWDDLTTLYNTKAYNSQRKVVDIIVRQLRDDLANMTQNKEVSLLGKWMPSINTSSETTKKLAREFAREIGISHKKYRHYLSKLREYIKVVERDLSSNNVSGIDYSKVPAKANLKYAKTFIRKDYDRRLSYIIDCISNGTSKMNISGLSPYEIVGGLRMHKFGVSDDNELIANYIWDKMISEGYKNDIGLDNCLCVLDGSGSMRTKIPNTSYTAMDVARGLSIYFAQTMKGPFHNIIMEFSRNTRWIDISECKNLVHTCLFLDMYCEWTTTNMYGVFKTLLKAAIDHNIPSTDMPKQILIVSDMEFDMVDNNISNLFDAIAREYHYHGYELPKLIFWNVLSRTYTIPKIDEGDNGLVLLSGFNQNAGKIAASDKKDPFDALIDVLESDRYKPIADVIKK